MSAPVMYRDMTDAQDMERGRVESLASRDGGSAFPIPGRHAVAHVYGMSLRDYFAAEVIERAVSITQSVGGDYDFDSAAQCAYRIADALLKARSE